MTIDGDVDGAVVAEHAGTVTRQPRSDGTLPNQPSDTDRTLDVQAGIGGPVARVIAEAADTDPGDLPPSAESVYLDAFV